jgi:acetyl-CoA C-acetyltransferase
MKSKTVVISTARTPFGKLGGALASLSATTLGGEAIRAAVERSKIDPSEIEHVIMGNVVQAGVGQAPARQAMFKAGLAKTTTFETINKVCASGLVAVAQAARLINADEKKVAVAGGMESMSNGPYAMLNARFGYRFGDGALVDLMNYDALVDPFSGLTMAQSQTRVNADLGITRDVQDEFAAISHQRAAASQRDGALAHEIVPLRVATKAKGKLVVDALPAPAVARVPVATGANGAASKLFHAPPENMQAQLARYNAYVTGDVPSTLVDADEPVRPDDARGAREARAT